MTGFFEIFNPGMRHTREQKDFDKVAVVPTRKGGRGPLQIDLENGTVVLPNRSGHLSERAVAGPESAQDEPADGEAAEATETAEAADDPGQSPGLQDDVADGAADRD